MEPRAAREVFRGTLIRVAVESWPAGEREVVHHPGAAGMVALTDGGRVILVRQLREAVRRELLEIPAGILDVDGEDGAAAASRELLEETGHRATDVRPLCSILTSPGFADERIDLFVGRCGDRPEGPAEDGIEVVALPLSEAVEAIRDGRITDAKTVAAILLADRFG